MNLREKIWNYSCFSFFNRRSVWDLPTTPPPIPVDIIALQNKVKVKKEEEHERKERLRKAKQLFIDKTIDIVVATVQKLVDKGVEFEMNPDIWWIEWSKSSKSSKYRGSVDLTLVDTSLAVRGGAPGKSDREYQFDITNRKDKFVFLYAKYSDTPFMLFQPSYGKSIMIKWTSSEYFETVRLTAFYRNCQKEFNLEFKVAPDIEKGIEKEYSTIEGYITKLVEMSIERNQ